MEWIDGQPVVANRLACVWKPSAQTSRGNEKREIISNQQNAAIGVSIVICRMSMTNNNKSHTHTVNIK